MKEDTLSKRHQMTDADAISTFVLGGNATFTIVSVATGKRFTYKVTASKKDNDDRLFVKLMQGPCNETNYGYLGTIFQGSQRPYYRHGSKSRIGSDAASAQAFSWLFPRLMHKHMPTNVEFWHEGRCCRCGRKLTVPESIESGIGPICAGRVSKAA